MAIKMVEGDLFGNIPEKPTELKIPKRYRLMPHPNEKASTDMPLGGGWIRIGGKDVVLKLSLEDIPYPHEKLDFEELNDAKSKAEKVINKLLAKLSANGGSYE